MPLAQTTPIGRPASHPPRAPSVTNANPDGRRRIARNLRLRDPEAVTHLPIDPFDGVDKWEALPRDGRGIRDRWF